MQISGLNMKKCNIMKFRNSILVYIQNDRIMHNLNNIKFATSCLVDNILFFLMSNTDQCVLKLGSYFTTSALQ